MSELPLFDDWPHTALAFRGYNVTNLGRSRELLRHPAYGDIVHSCLLQMSSAASGYLGRPIDLLARVESGEETTLASYAEAVALVLAMEEAQLAALQELHGVDWKAASMSFGYSLGEIAALAAGGVFRMIDAARIPLSLTADCVALADDATLGVLFTRSQELPETEVQRLCLRVNSEGRGVVGLSSILAPNSLLLVGQGETLNRVRDLAAQELSVRVMLKKNKDRWPPLHTPLMWQRQIPDRAGDLMHTLPMSLDPPEPPVLSLVTGRRSYTGLNTRELLRRWVDHPQRLWDAIDDTLRRGIKTILHIGPEPNLIPATYKRLTDNVQQQLHDHFTLQALSAAVRRPWLASLLPRRATLLRAPLIRHVNLEDWLLENPPA